MRRRRKRPNGRRRCWSGGGSEDTCSRLARRQRLHGCAWIRSREMLRFKELRLLLVGLCCVVLAHCGGGGGAGNNPNPSPSPTPTPVGVTAQDLQHCVDVVNGYRNQVGRPPLARSAQLDAFSATAAKTDGASHTGHQYFASNNGGGVALAENEIPWYSLIQFHTISGVIETGTAQMWQEGQGGGHHDHIVGPYAQIGCGIYVNGDEVTVVTDFR